MVVPLVANSRDYIDLRKFENAPSVSRHLAECGVELRAGAKFMTSARSVTVVGILVASITFIFFAPALRVQAQRSGAATRVNWPLHNLDLAGSRYSTMDQINSSNVKTLTP